MAFNKITDEDRQGKGNVGQPDTPGLTTGEMQELLDSLPNLTIDKFNELIDALGAETAAGNIGMSVPDGLEANANIESVITNMLFVLNQCSAQRHTHNNKAVLDGFTESTKSEYDNVVQLLESISQIQTTLSNTDEAIPTSKAVIDYYVSADITGKVFDSIYPVGTVYSTTLAIEPNVIFGRGTWAYLDTDSYGIRRYVRGE